VIIPSTAKFLEVAVILPGMVPVTFKRAQRTKTPTEHQLALGDGGQRGWSVG
jgi:hypothetical protein